MSMSKIFATILLHESFPSIKYATLPYKEKSNFAFIPNPLDYPGGWTKAFELKSHLICFISIVPLSTCKILVKLLTTDLDIVKFKYLIFDPA